MNTTSKPSKILGIAFLLQFITSFSSGVFLQPALILPGNASESMLRIANHPSLLKIYILVEMLTALGVIFLGAILYLVLRKKNEIMALTAFAFYILEGVIIATSKLQALPLLQMSQAYVTTGQPDHLLTLASQALTFMDSGFTLLMLAFCPGAILFYYLLHKSNVVPRWLSLWGLITVAPLLFAIPLVMFDVQVPEFIIIPYIPFEFVIGVWILVKGIPEANP
jgi:hypothetical protein